jgi:hypothetical protein
MIARSGNLRQLEQSNLQPRFLHAFQTLLIARFAWPQWGVDGNPRQEGLQQHASWIWNASSLLRRYVTVARDLAE